MSIHLTRGISTLGSMETTRSSINEEAAIALPDDLKRQLCYDLLHEFGAGTIRENQKGELTHNCTLPLGGHTDGNSMTASVNYKSLTSHCFVCGYGGSLQWWIAINRGLQTEQVGQWLSDKAGLGRNSSYQTTLAIINAIINPPSNKPEPMPFYNDKILNRFNEWGMFHPYLTDPWLPGDAGGREIPEDNLAKYEVGYADQDTEFNYFRRIILPARWNGRIVGWQARRLDPEDPDYTIKYKNSPSFPRDRILYGDIESRRAVLVESPMSVLRHTHQCSVVSTYGAKVTTQQIRLLEKFESLILFPDPDKAGYQWTRNLLNKLSRKVHLDVVDSPYSKVDAADLDEDTFDDLCSKAVPGALWTPRRYRDMIEYSREK